MELASRFLQVNLSYTSENILLRINITLLIIQPHALDLTLFYPSSYFSHVLQIIEGAKIDRSW